MRESSVIPILLALTLGPLLAGVINRTTAMVAGRRGAPLLQLYFDIARLLRKGVVYSRTTSWVFRAGPVIGLSATLGAAALLPFGGRSPLLAFPGDVVLFAYLLGLARYVTVLAALDTGSAFEGMGASREVQFSALAEPALLLGLAALARRCDTASLAGLFTATDAGGLAEAGPLAALVAMALFIVYLAENARIPVDDPNTHLELTMIHEVMVLDHSGPDLAFILYGTTVKLWLLGSLVVHTVIPRSAERGAAGLALSLAGMAAIGVATGCVESSMARLRLLRVPQLLLGATALAVMALVLAFR